MSLIIDASVAFKWFVPEIDDDKALALLDGDQALCAPDLIFAEVANALWVRLRSVSKGEEATRAAEARLRLMIDRSYPSAELVADAVELAFALRHPIYDCIYLALCKRENMMLVTADERLQRAAQSGGLGDLIRPLA